MARRNSCGRNCRNDRRVCGVVCSRVVTWNHNAKQWTGKRTGVHLFSHYSFSESDLNLKIVSKNVFKPTLTHQALAYIPIYYYYFILIFQHPYGAICWAAECPRGYTGRLWGAAGRLFTYFIIHSFSQCVPKVYQWFIGLLWALFFPTTPGLAWIRHFYTQGCTGATQKRTHTPSDAPYLHKRAPTHVSVASNYGGRKHSSPGKENICGKCISHSWSHLGAHFVDGSPL